MSIKTIDAFRVWDSRGRPTIEVRVETTSGAVGSAIAPAGASTGSGEAVDLRDGGERFGGYDVLNAIAAIYEILAPRLIGVDEQDQHAIDAAIEGLDGAANFATIGGNAAVATSMATAHVAAAVHELPLWLYLRGGKDDNVTLPVPEVQIFGGGAHADGQMDLQDFMVVPFGAKNFAEALEWVAEIYRAAGAQLKKNNKSYGVADEGGYWPSFSSNDQAIEALLQAIEVAGFDPRKSVGISLDIAANQFFRGDCYRLSKGEKNLSPDAWFDCLTGWLQQYPILMIEDPFEEHDLERHARLQSAFGHQMQIVGDDLLVTNSANVAQAVEAKACNTLLCKPNQAGTLTRARLAAERAYSADWDVILSARSGETEDVTICHLAVGWGIKQFKVGSFARSERMAKWNEVLRIERSLGSKARYAGRDVFAKFLSF